MNLTLMIDNRFHDAAKMFRPHYAVFDTTNLGAISGIYDLPDVTASTLSRYLN